jgi:hypothetical protein
VKIRNAVLPIVAAATIGTPVAFAEQASASPAVKSAASAKTLFIDAYRTRNGCTFSEHPRKLKAGQSVVISPEVDVSVVVDVPTVKASRLRSGYSTTSGTASVNSANTLHLPLVVMTQERKSLLHV